MIFDRTKRPIWIIASLALILPAACLIQSDGGSETTKTKSATQSPQIAKQSNPDSADAQSIAPEADKPKPAKTPSLDLSIGNAPEDPDIGKIDWGQEIPLDEILAMAKSGRVQEIEWYVMPNTIRILDLDGKLFHLRNERKSVDMRNKLINEGVKIGKGGISFRHVF